MIWIVINTSHGDFYQYVTNQKCAYIIIFSAFLITVFPNKYRCASLEVFPSSALFVVFDSLFVGIKYPTHQLITSITSYYSMLGQESSSPWTNQSDQTYGTVGDGYWRYEDANDAYVAKARSTINQSRASRGAPNSLQWEFEFGDNAVIYTMGGNDTSEETDGEDTLRVIFTGTFDYKNNDIKGRLSAITHARWGNHYRSINGVDLPVIQIEDIKTYIPSQAPIEINSFDDINQSHRERNNGSHTIAEWDELSSSENRESFISKIPLFQNQWLQW